MKITIHQPSYLPWIPFLEKGLQSDIFVMLDNVQFEKNGEQNRNRIKTPNGPTWLTVPVSRSAKSLITEVEIPESDQKWRTKHRRAVETNYRKAPHFEEVAPPLFEILDQEYSRLCDLNLATVRLFLEFAGFAGKLIRSSEMDIEGTGSERVLNICKALKSQTYYSGVGGFDYLDLVAFSDANVEVWFQDYQHLEYPQLYPKAGFVPRLSALDLFMNVGIGDMASQQIRAGSRWLTAAALAAKRSSMEGPDG